ncbi:hypothetical protein HBO37_25755 [Pseudomonas proteolytica]|uniref:hypothetical protein n=1 Tax=Pseudomonas proteolytica TaxID=219574 RepID=UPI00147477CD|nr:hypothetical protein [Pseudomonas proteolytica]NMZ08758.1 hypothetical protein [Pseudomonas proteolytica]
MTSAFKYAEQKFSESLLMQGGVRIGTLHDFRKTEHKDGVCDALEGIKTIRHYVEKSTTRDVDSIHTRALTAFGAVNVGPNCEVITTDCHFVREINHPNMFVHCMSNVYSKKTADQFEGVDSCVEVTDLRAFYWNLTQALVAVAPVVRFLGVYKVKYMSRDQSWNGFDWDESVSPALIKEFEFSEQSELRACWLPSDGAVIEPVILKCKELTKYCVSRSMPVY